MDFKLSFLLTTVRLSIHWLIGSVLAPHCLLLWVRVFFFFFTKTEVRFGQQKSRDQKSVCNWSSWQLYQSKKQRGREGGVASNKCPQFLQNKSGAFIRTQLCVVCVFLCVKERDTLFYVFLASRGGWWMVSCASGLNDQLVCKNFLPFQILFIERKNVLFAFAAAAFSLMQWSPHNGLSESEWSKYSK